MKKISIVIVTYNSEHDIYDCLSSIMTTNDLDKESVEIIIVDNNSKNADSMFFHIHELYGNKIITIKNTENSGYGQGNNIGIKNASAPIILIMNPDVRLVSTSFKKVCDQFMKDEQLSIYGMKQLLNDGGKSLNSFCCTSLVNGYFNTFFTGFCNRLNLYIPSLMYFSGSCFFIRKSMFEKIGLFDEKIFMYGEETDIHHRMKVKFGAHFFYNKKMCYKHLTLGRKSDIENENRVLQSILYVNQKFGYSKEKTIRNKIQNIRILLFRETIRKVLKRHHNEGNLKLLNQQLDYFRKMSNVQNNRQKSTS